MNIAFYFIAVKSSQKLILCCEFQLDYAKIRFIVRRILRLPYYAICHYKRLQLRDTTTNRFIAPRVTNEDYMLSYAFYI